MAPWVWPVLSYASKGLGLTIGIFLITTVAGVVVGVVAGTLMTMKSPFVRWLLRAYVEIWRGLPVIVTLFLIFFILPEIGLRFSNVTAACIGISLWASANIAEITRGAVESIPVQQYRAAGALGLNWTQTMVFVVVPQAVKRMLPPTVGLLALLAQSTTLASILGVQEVLERAHNAIERLTVNTGDSHAATILAGIMVVFFVMCFPITELSRRLERSLR